MWLALFLGSLQGVMLGPDQPVILHLCDNIKQADEALNGIKME